MRSEIVFLNVNQTPGMSSTVWEYLKAYLREQIISFCAKQNKESSKWLANLADKIKELDLIRSVSPTPIILKQHLLLQAEYNLISTRQAEYLVFKTRSSFYEHGEKTGRLLANMLRQQWG